MVNIMYDNIKTILGSAVTGVLGVFAVSNSFDIWLDRIVGVVGIVVGLLTAAKLIHQWWINRKRNKDGQK